MSARVDYNIKYQEINKSDLFQEGLIQGFKQCVSKIFKQFDPLSTVRFISLHQNIAHLKCRVLLLFSEFLLIFRMHQLLLKKYQNSIINEVIKCKKKNNKWIEIYNNFDNDIPFSYIKYTKFEFLVLVCLMHHFVSAYLYNRSVDFFPFFFALQL